ncbi:MAG: YkuS family protein [Bacillota bacterium]
MAGKIAVQENLSEIKQKLAALGYEVVHPSNPQGAEAFIVTTGVTENKGIGEGSTFLPVRPLAHAPYAPVIDATGKDPDQVLAELEKVVL